MTNPQNTNQQKNIGTLLEDGNKLMQARKYKEAITKFDKILDVYPLDISVLNNKSLAMTELGQGEEALEMLKNAKTKGARDWDVMRSQAFILGKMGKYRQAFDLLDLLLILDPSYSDVKDDDSEDETHAEMLEEEMSATRDIIRDILYLMNSDDLNKEIGERMRYSGGDRVLIAILDLILEREPNNVDTLNMKGLSLNELGKHEEAIKLFNKILEIDPKNTYALKNKADVLSKINKPSI